MKRAAIFDFDDTLVLGDSFMPFLTYAAGRGATYAALGAAVSSYSLWSSEQRQGESIRTLIKSFLIHRLLKGKRPEDLGLAIAKTRAWQKVNEPIMRVLHEHKEKGDTVVIASGSLDLYLPGLLSDVPHDALLCTNVGVEDGLITGVMTLGNCVRLRKAERVKAWMEANGPFDESFGYGNYPHDVPMLSLVKHRILVS